MTGDTAGGVWTFTMELAQGLLENGWNVLLATFGPRVTEAQERQAAAVSGLEWLHHWSKLEWMDEPWRDIGRAGRWLLHLARKWRPDVVHLNTLCHGDIGIEAPVLLTAHSCVDAWWSAVRGSDLPLSWRRYHNEVEKSLGAVDMLAAPSRAALQDVLLHYPTVNAPAHAIYNGRKAFETATPKDGCVLSVGRLWDEAKNISAVAQVSPLIQWPIYVAGDGGDEVGDCRLLGELAQEELLGWYKRASIYLLPAKYEPFGLSILEAALSGCALVLGDISSLREIWMDSALFIPPNDCESLKLAIDKLIEDDEQRAVMGQRACQRAGYFSAQRMTQSYLDAYLTLTDTRSACAS